jgi:hypothetical protein
VPHLGQKSPLETNWHIEQILILFLCAINFTYLRNGKKIIGKKKKKIPIDLSKLYLKETGTVQHHNMDKPLLMAGQSQNIFGEEN